MIDHTDIPSHHALVKDFRGPNYQVDNGEQQHRERVEDVESYFAVSKARACSGSIFGYSVA